MNVNINGNYFNLCASHPTDTRLVYDDDESNVYAMDIPPNVPVTYELSICTRIIDATVWIIIGYNNEGELLGYTNLSSQIRSLPAERTRWAPHHHILFPSLRTPCVGFSVVFLPFSKSLTVEDGNLWYTVYIEGPNGAWRPIKHLIGTSTEEERVDVLDLEVAVQQTAAHWGENRPI